MGTPPQLRARVRELSRSRETPQDGFTTVNRRGNKTNRFTDYCGIKNNWITKVQDIEDLMGKDTACQLTGELIKITTNCENAFRKLQHYLTDNKIPYQTIDPRGQRPKKVLLKGIPVAPPPPKGYRRLYVGPQFLCHPNCSSHQ